jgi:predicted phage terminase large subunit-like protein
VSLAKDKKTGYLFVEDIVFDRLPVEKQIQCIVDKNKINKYHLFGVETNAFQYVVASELRKLSKRTIPIRELVNYSDKKMRFEGVIPFLVDGTVIFDEYKYQCNQQYRNAVDQMCLFTGIDNANDDFPDALEMAVRIARAKKFKRLTRQAKDR